MIYHFVLLFSILSSISFASIFPSYFPITGNFTQIIQKDSAFRLALQTAAQEAQRRYSTTQAAEVIEAGYQITGGAEYRILFSMGNKVFEGRVFVQIWEETAELLSLKLLVEEKQKSSEEEAQKNETQITEEEFNPPIQNKNGANSTNQTNSTNETEELSEEKESKIDETVEKKDQDTIDLTSNIIVLEEKGEARRLLAEWERENQQEVGKQKRKKRKKKNIREIIN